MVIIIIIKLMSCNRHNYIIIIHNQSWDMYIQGSGILLYRLLLLVHEFMHNCIYVKYIIIVMRFIIIIIASSFSQHHKTETPTLPLQVSPPLSTVRWSWLL